MSYRFDSAAGPEIIVTTPLFEIAALDADLAAKLSAIDAIQTSTVE
jgi:hypothetical protein